MVGGSSQHEELCPRVAALGKLTTLLQTASSAALPWFTPLHLRSPRIVHNSSVYLFIYIPMSRGAIINDGASVSTRHDGPELHQISASEITGKFLLRRLYHGSPKLNE